MQDCLKVQLEIQFFAFGESKFTFSEINFDEKVKINNNVLCFIGFHGYVEIYSHKICKFAAVKVSLYQSGTKDAKKNWCIAVENLRNT